MADLIRLRGDSVRMVLDIRDMLDLIDSHLGDEARRWLEEYLSEIEDPGDYISNLESEVERLKEHHRDVMQVLRTESETIAGLIREREIDRQRLSTVAGNIGAVTWRELNV